MNDLLDRELDDEETQAPPEGLTALPKPAPLHARRGIRVPRHVGLIPDGNRRWAQERGLPKREGYAAGIEPGVHLLRLCSELGVQEASVYGFTQDNTRRPKDQTAAYRSACVGFAEAALEVGVSLYALGDTSSPLFPEELLPYASPPADNGDGTMRVNLLVNYGWEWDLKAACNPPSGNETSRPRSFASSLASAAVSRIDLVVRWGGRRRLSGFLPVQSVYADFYVVDDYWPDYREEHLFDALRWYKDQDVTLGG